MSRLASAWAAEPRRQVAAIPMRRAPSLEVLLISSLDSGRWIVPKGWPIAGKTDRESAALEAFEEAGVQGRIAASPIGVYEYVKRRKGETVRCRVDVYPLNVETELTVWPEKGRRRLLWTPCALAACMVEEPGLSRLLADLALREPEPAADRT